MVDFFPHMYKKTGLYHYTNEQQISLSSMSVTLSQLQFNNIQKWTICKF